MDKHLPLLQKDPNFFVYIKVVNVLIKKYNKNIFLNSYKNLISKIDPSLGELIEFLGKNGLWDKKHLKAIEKELEKKDFSIKFTLQSPNKSQQKVYNKINDFLKAEFKEYTLQNDSQTQLGIDLKGDGYQYKRNIDSDLNILLQ
ncbi:MAG: hypothetical protein M0P94_01245 [Candidatus Absconditabacterales bacterium]|nr:hypothetical protein [Candidatus Absconditabacterales bacterium]